MDEARLTPKALVSAGWTLTRRHPASSYGVPVVLTPDGNPVGDGEFIQVTPDGAITEFLSAEGTLFLGSQLRQLLSHTSLPPWDADDEQEVSGDANA